MIHESNPNYNAIAAEQFKYDNPKYGMSCGHAQPFWDIARKADYGDLILCQQCNRYYAKIKNMAWVCLDRFSKGETQESLKKLTFSSNAPKGGRNNHLGGFRAGDYYLTHVECRVTD